MQIWLQWELSAFPMLQNLARGVTEEDLVWLFGNCFESRARCTDQMHLRLMQVSKIIISSADYRNAPKYV